MSATIEIKGVDQAIKAIQKAAASVGQNVARGLTRAGLFLQRESQLLCPVDTGVLRNSAFTRTTGAGVNTEVRVGYTVNYAVYVHENLEAAHGDVFNAKYTDPIAAGLMHNRGSGQQAKFLETPIRTKWKMMADIITAEAGK